MATKQETALAQKGVVEKRVRMSASLLERMGMTVDQYERVMLNALLQTPGLAECTNDSLDLAVMHCIQAGLLPDGKQAAIIPFNSKQGKIATLVPMIEGRLMLARRATPGLTLRAKLVYQDDEWEYAEGKHTILRHVPSPTGDRTDANIIAAYATAHFPGSMEPEFEVFFRGDIDRFRAYSRSRGGPWETHYGEMAKKAVLGQVLKRLPKAVGAPPEPQGMSTMDADAISLEDVGISDTSSDQPVASQIQENDGTTVWHVEVGGEIKDNMLPSMVPKGDPLPYTAEVVDTTTGEILDEQAPTDDDDAPF